VKILWAAQEGKIKKKRITSGGTTSRAEHEKETFLKRVGAPGSGGKRRKGDEGGVSFMTGCSKRKVAAKTKGHGKGERTKLVHLWGHKEDGDSRIVNTSKNWWATEGTLK